MNRRDDIRELVRKEFKDNLIDYIQSLKFSKVNEHKFYNSTLNVKNHEYLWFQGNIYRTDGVLDIAGLTINLNQWISQSINTLGLEYNDEEFICTAEVHYENSLLTIHIDY